MNLELENKKVLITGASRGIGLAISRSFLEESAKTCIVSRGSKELFDNEKILQNAYSSNKIFATKCDCTNVKDLKALEEDIHSTWGELDILVINVGDGRSVQDKIPNESNWNKTWANNFESALYTARVFLPMLEKSNGVMLFISSIAGIEAFGAPTDYSTAKSAVISLAKNLARKSTNVRVNVIAPGNIIFPGSSWDVKNKNNKKNVDEMLNKIVPMNRFGVPEEISDAAVFLCSNRASFITGETLVVDGGQRTGLI